MHLPDPQFPPLLTGHPVKAPARAFASACDGAAAGRLGAGDVVWARDTARLDMAIVLEPEVAAARAAEMLSVALVAVGDSLGTLVPPEVAVTFGWPGIIRVNGGVAGEARLALSPERDEADVPSWLVVGIAIELRRTGRSSEPGLAPDATDLVEEGCGEITRTELVESLGRHFLSWVHGWETEGFRSVHELLLGRMDGIGEEIGLTVAGRRRTGRFVGLDEHGDMLLETADGTVCLRALDMAAQAEATAQ